MKNRVNGSLLGPVILSGIVSGWTITQYGDSQPLARIPAVTDRKDRFIAAVDWFVDKNPEFIWPFASMRAAPYESVRMVIEWMPLIVMGRGKDKRPEALVASRHLKINGRLQKPVRIIRPTSNQPEQQEFLAKLEGGRLRLTLILPPGATLDPEHALVRVKLYEVTRATPNG